eukprot:1160088-Pelagomonas_calceolata.AAC.14
MSTVRALGWLAHSPIELTSQALHQIPCAGTLLRSSVNRKGGGQERGRQAPQAHINAYPDLAPSFILMWKPR